MSADERGYLVGLLAGAGAAIVIVAAIASLPPVYSVVAIILALIGIAVAVVTR